MNNLKGKVMYEGKEVEIEFSEETTKSIVEQLEKTRLTGWESNDGGFLVHGDGLVIELSSSGCGFSSYADNLMIFSTKEKAKEVNREQLLYRKLKKFSDEHDGDKIVWSKRNESISKSTNKYTISYDSCDGLFYVILHSFTRNPNAVYFYNRKTAEKAIELFANEIRVAMGLKPETGIKKYAMGNWEE